MSFEVASLRGAHGVQPLPSTVATAEARAERIRLGIIGFAHLLKDVADAHHQRDWVTLRYASWDAYVAAEFNPERVQLPRELRERAVSELRVAGLSTRAIASALGVGDATVRRDLAGASYDAPAEITGADGKQYPAARPAKRSDLNQERVESARLAVDRGREWSLRIDGEVPVGCGAESRDEAVAWANGFLTEQGFVCPDSWEAVDGSSELLRAIYNDRQVVEGSADASASDGSAEDEAPEGIGFCGCGAQLPVNSVQAGATACEVCEPDAPSPTRYEPVSCEVDGCEAGLAADEVEAGYTRCGDCDPEGDHVAADEGTCKGCLKTDPAYRAAVVAAVAPEFVRPAPERDAEDQAGPDDLSAGMPIPGGQLGSASSGRVPAPADPVDHPSPVASSGSVGQAGPDARSAGSPIPTVVLATGDPTGSAQADPDGLSDGSPVPPPGPVGLPSAVDPTTASPQPGSAAAAAAHTTTATDERTQSDGSAGADVVFLREISIVAAALHRRRHYGRLVEAARCSECAADARVAVRDLADAGCLAAGP
jgi:transposase-like protein